jgi:hypothetical protein
MPSGADAGADTPPSTPSQLSTNPLQAAADQAAPGERLIAPGITGATNVANNNYSSVTFNSDRSISDTSAQSLTNQALARSQAAPDGARTGVHVNESAGGITRMSVNNSGASEPAFSSSTASVNMGSIPNGEQGILSSLNRGGSVLAASEARPSDLVTLPGGITTTLENATRLGFVRNDKLHGYVNASEPQLREADGTGERERAQVAAQAAQAEAESTAKANTHPSEVIEAAHQSFVTQVSTSDQIGLMLALNSGKPVAPALMARVAEQLGQQPEQAQETLNNMAMGVQAQSRVMAKAQGLDPDQAADWIRTHRSDRVAAALQQHTLHRDVIGAWSGLLADVKRATAARG